MNNSYDPINVSLSKMTNILQWKDFHILNTQKENRENV